MPKMTERQKTILNKTALIALDAIKQTREDLNAQGKFTLENELYHTLTDIRAVWRELVPDVFGLPDAENK